MSVVLNQPFSRGTCPVYTFGPDDRSTPIVLFFPDAFGPRPATFAIAGELVASGLRVLMPDQFYEHIPYTPLQPISIFQGGDRDRLMELVGSIDQPKIDQDVASLLELAKAVSADDVPFAAVGYCMGGRYALSAATASPRVRFAASIHGSLLAPAEGDGAHRRFHQASGRIYIAAAGMDPTYDAAEHGRLAEALRAADVDHLVENYKGAGHGWTMSDIPIFDPAAYRRHLARIGDNLSELLLETR